MQFLWQRSSFCGHNGNCVEVRQLGDDMVAIRNSTTPDAPPLEVSASDFRDLIERIKRGDV